MPVDSAFQLPHSPVAALGTLSLLAGFLVNGYALAASIVGQRQNRPRLVTSAIYAAWAFSALMALASSLMIYAFLGHDYTIKYVAHYSDTSMPLFYKITAYWGGLDGSLLFWVSVLSIFSAIAVYLNRHRHRDLIGYVIATVSAVSAFFLAVLLYSKNPFATFLTTPPFDGKGLNPLLQNYWMVIHPPALYLGFVGMTVPFAFCIAALASGRLDDSWLHSVRVWVIVAWFFLSLGLTLGGIWAYEELGWGGYWAWDPVENAGLLPWFTATAFLHSVMIQERRGMLKVWNVVLVILTFFLTIVGTFLTRSGVVQSVHAFGQDNELAVLFLIFMAVILIVSFGLVIYRLPRLRSAHEIESMVSREFVFLLNNWILLAAAFFVLFATMFPTFSEWIVKQRITVGPPFFNKWMIPVGLTLLFLTGAGPLLAWRATTRKKLVDQFLFPLLAAIATVGLVAILLPEWRVRSAFTSDKIQLPLALTCFGLVAFTAAAMLQEFYRGMKVRRRQSGTDPITSLIGIVLAKRRKYGGYIAHLGIALMFLGFAGKARTLEKQVTLEKPGQSFSVGGLTFHYDDFTVSGNENRNMFTGQVTVKKGEQAITTLYPARWQYLKSDEQATTEVAIHRHLDRDIYLVLNGFNPDTKLVNFTVFLNPLVNWVWIGFGLLAFGSGICLIPDWLVRSLKPRRSAAGRGIETAIFLFILGGVTLGRVQVAQASEGTDMQHQVEDVPSFDEESVPPIANRLFKDLVCMCGGCKRLTLHECPCAYAAKERETIMGMLAGRDLSPAANEKAAYDEVVAAFVGKYGGHHVLTVPPDSPFNRLAWMVPYAAVAGGLIVLVTVAGRWVRRGRKDDGKAEAQPSEGARQHDKYDDKLDEELDEID